MNDFYTSILAVGDNLLVRGYRGGKRFSERVRYSPKLFVSSKKQPTSDTWYNISGNTLERVDFDTIREARDFLRRYEGVSGMDIYGLPRFEYVYLNETYPGEILFDRDLIRVANIDIEVASAEGFPSPDEASQPVVAITMKKDGEYVVIGCGNYIPKEKDVRYINCRDEEELLSVFLDEWERGTQPDVVTGWNIMFFDIPYLVRRIAKVLGTNNYKRLSPWALVREKSVMVKGSHKEQKMFTLEGIAILDYLEMYKKFTYSQQESYRLDHIAHVELDERKLDYSEFESLHTMYLSDYTKFIDYNIQDVKLVGRIDDKMKLIDMALALAYDAKVNIGDVFTQVRMWDVIIHNYLWKDQIAVPSFGGGHKDEAYEGAYVKDPIIGAHDWVISFDLNSLYPHLIMQYNISPEMLVKGKRANVSIDQMLSDAPLPIIEGCSLAPNGCYFRNDKQGFLAAIMEKMYNDRVIYKDKMIIAKKQYETATDPDAKIQLKKNISRYNNIQMAKKIQLNSAYGALGNQFFRFFVLDQATAITFGGQLSIRWAVEHMNSYLNNMLETKDVDYVIASDMDSLYISLDRLVSKVFAGRDNVSKKKIVDFLDRSAKEVFEPVIEEFYGDLAKRTNAFQQKMSMKREVIADRGIWTGKKHYILNVHDSEGVRFATPKLKMLGIETVKSSTPSSCRKALTEAIKIIMSGTEQDIQAYIAKYAEEFRKLPMEEIAMPRGIQGLDKYDRTNAGGTPIHVRGALTYNRKIDHLKLGKKFQKIKEGDKLKYCYLKMPNPMHENVISILHTLPKEFGLQEYIDYDVQFEKAFLAPIKAILAVIGWTEEKKSTIEDFFA